MNEMVPLLTPLASLYAYASAHGIIGQKDHGAPHFDHLDLKMQWCDWFHMLLIPMPGASYDTDTDAIGITWPKNMLLLISMSFT